MTEQKTSLVAGTVIGGWWLDLKVILANGLIGALFRMARRVTWLMSWWREPAVLAALTAAAWWQWPPLLLVVAAAAAWYLWSAQGRRMQALEAERRDRLRVARHPRLSKNWPIRWAPVRADPWAIDLSSGTRVPRPIPGSHVLIGGMTGCGKSGAVNALMYSLAQNSEAHFVGIDLKGGMELDAWWPRCDIVVTEPEDARTLLDRVGDLIAERAKAAAGTTRRDRTSPPLVVVVDELEEVFSEEKEAEKLARRVARLGRATNVWIIAATQSPMAETISSPFRSQFGIRLVGATDSHDMARTIAGHGRLPDTPTLAVEIGERNLPWNLDVGESEQGVPGPDAGQFLLMSSSRRRVVRTVWRTDQEIAAVVARTRWVAEHPVITLDTEPEEAVEAETVEEPELPVEAPESEPEPEPDMTWPRLMIVAELRRRGVPLPDNVTDGRRWPKAKLLELAEAS